MKKRTIALVAALAGGAVFAVMRDDSAAASASATTSAPYTRARLTPSLEESEGEPTLPPDHAAIAPDEATSEGAEAIEPTDLAAALTWKAPAAWPSAPNPSAMRLATHKVPHAATDAEDAELSIVRAGGDVEANLARWRDQFDGAGGEKQEERTVRGFKVTIVEMDGKYQGGMGAASAPRAGWALLGAIVLAPEQPYFFKLTGPKATVHSARAAFDALLGSIAPISTP